MAEPSPDRMHRAGSLGASLCDLFAAIDLISTGAPEVAVNGSPDEREVAARSIECCAAVAVAALRHRSPAPDAGEDVIAATEALARGLAMRWRECFDAGRAFGREPDGRALRLIRLAEKFGKGCHS